MIIAYILWYDGEWECVYVGTNFDDANMAIRKNGPADGSAITWDAWQSGDRVPTLRMEINILRIPSDAG